MRWLIVRQYRTGVLVSAPVVAALCALLLVSGFGIRGGLSDAGVSSCLFGAAPSEDCLGGARFVLQDYRWMDNILPWMNFLPALIAVVVAAPVISEFEHRTYHLAWTQSIGRGRWLLWKLGSAFAVAAVVAVAFTLLMSWWYRPEDAVEGRWGNNFNFEGTVFFAYTMFAVALTLAVGVFTRRSLPAFAATLVLFLVARIWVENAIRPDYMAPEVQVTRLAERENPPLRSWVIGQKLVDAEGDDLPQLMVANGAKATQVPREADVYERLSYQPANRFWRFQAVETAIFLSAAAVLVVASVAWTRLRLT